MAVTKTTTTVAATWTAAQLATGFSTAMTDAGLISSSTWYDSFLNTVENRICEVQYDNTKTYGKTYYWFQFTTAGIFLSSATGWSTGSHVPTGTQYVDYYATTTNATTNHKQLLTLSNTTNVTFTVYKSGIYAWILIRNGSASHLISIVPSGVSFQTWVDLNKNSLSAALTVGSTTYSTDGRLLYVQAQGVFTRRTLGIGSGLNGQTTLSYFTYNSSMAAEVYSAYRTYGHVSGGTANGSGTVQVGVTIPAANSTANSAYSSNYYPIVHTLPVAPWSTSSGPTDFGVCGDYVNKTYALQDTLVVSAGSEEWEVLAFNNGASTLGPSILFLARTV